MSNNPMGKDMDQWVEKGHGPVEKAKKDVKGTTKN